MNNEHFKSQTSLIPPCPIHLMNIIVDKRQMTIFDIKHLHAAEAPDDYFQIWLLCQKISVFCVKLFEFTIIGIQFS